MAAQLDLKYVVITSVNRDDLSDGGSHHFAETVRQVRLVLPETRVEVLTPDFCGDQEPWRAFSMPVRMYSTITLKLWAVFTGAFARKQIISSL